MNFIDLQKSIDKVFLWISRFPSLTSNIKNILKLTILLKWIKTPSYLMDGVAYCKTCKYKSATLFDWKGTHIVTIPLRKNYNSYFFKFLIRKKFLTITYSHQPSLFLCDHLPIESRISLTEMIEFQWRLTQVNLVV